MVATPVRRHGVMTEYLPQDDAQSGLTGPGLVGDQKKRYTRSVRRFLDRESSPLLDIFPVSPE